MSGGFSKNYVPANTIDSSNNSAGYDKDLNAGQYSPSKPTCTPTKNEANVAESLKAESKGKHKMDRKCSKNKCLEIFWIHDRLLMGILKFS